MKTISWTEDECKAFYNHARKIIKYDYALWAKMIAKALGEMKPLIIADIACGPGLLAFELMKFVSPDCEFIMLDSADQMLSIVELKDAGQHKIKLINCKAEALEILDESVDIALCKDLLAYINEPEKVFSEIYRILKPNGLAFIIDYDSEAYKFIALILYWIIKLKFGKEQADRFWYGYENGYPSTKLLDQLSEMGFGVRDMKMRGISYIVRVEK